MSAKTSSARRPQGNSVRRGSPGPAVCWTEGRAPGEPAVHESATNLDHQGEKHLARDHSSDDLDALCRRLANEDREAYNELCRRLRDPLCASAKRSIRQHPELSPVYDEEDATDSGLTQLWDSLLKNKMRPPDGIDDFMRLARTFIHRRITAKARKLVAEKRQPPGGIYVPDDLDLFACNLPGPEVEVIAKDTTEWLLSLLGGDLLQIAELRLLKKSIDEIATRLEIPPRTIQRRLQEIGKIWEEAMRDR